jgi:asparagine synthetase A
VFFAVIVWFLWPTARAQTLGLSSNDINVVNRLSTVALKHSSSVLNAERDLENTQFEEGAFGQVLKSLNVTVGGGVGVRNCVSLFLSKLHSASRAKTILVAEHSKSVTSEII